MKIALIGDIHANLPALEAVFAEIQREGCSQILDTGDAVGYGPFPNEVIQLLHQHQVRSIMGNYDRLVCRFGLKPRKTEKLQQKDPLKCLAVKWTREVLTPRNLSYLDSLPESQERIIGGMRLLLVHGTTDSRKEGLRANTSDERLHELAEDTTADIVVSGHSHDPFIRKVNKTWFVNTGSVGRSGDGDARATFVIAEIAHRKLTAEIRRIDYDLDRLLIALRQAGLPEEFGAMFQRGVHLSQVTGGGEPSAQPAKDPAQHRT